MKLPIATQDVTVCYQPSHSRLSQHMLHMLYWEKISWYDIVYWPGIWAEADLGTEQWSTNLLWRHAGIEETKIDKLVKKQMIILIDLERTCNREAWKGWRCIWGRYWEAAFVWVKRQLRRVDDVFADRKYICQTRKIFLGKTSQMGGFVDVAICSQGLAEGVLLDCVQQS